MHKPFGGCSARWSGKGAPRWKQSRSYQVSRRRKATKERKLAAHRKSLHGQMVHQIVRTGNTIITEKLSYKGWQKRYGSSVGRCAPGMLIDHLRRTGASHGRHPARGPHAKYQTLPILPWLREVRSQAALTALAPVPVRHRAGGGGSARPVCRGSFGLSRSVPLPSPRVPGMSFAFCRCLGVRGWARGHGGGAPAGSTRASYTTRE